MGNEWERTAAFKPVGLSLVTIFLFLAASTSVNNLVAQNLDYFDQPYSKTYETDMVNRMKEGIDNFIDGYTERIIKERENLWDRNFSSPTAYQTSVATNRDHLREIIGAIDERSQPNMLVLSKPGEEGKIAETQKYTIFRVAWDVMGGLKSEGLLLKPKGEVKASVVMVGDADELPESYTGLIGGSAVGNRLAENGVQVIIPTLVNRDTQFSGSNTLIPYNNFWRKGKDSASVWTNETHREWIHRQGYIMGRHIIGLEVQKILSAVDWLEQNDPEIPIGIIGYGEGGLLAMYSSALDTRIDASWISGYFGPRDKVWKEPVYRNVWGLLVEFGDAEIASLIAPRGLVIEPSNVPLVEEPPIAKEGQRDFGSPGTIETPSREAVVKEFERLLSLFPEDAKNLLSDFHLTQSVESFGSSEALSVFADDLKLNITSADESLQLVRHDDLDSEKRQYRVFSNMVEYIQDMIPTAERTRNSFLEGDLSSKEAWNEDMERYRQLFHDELVGHIDQALLPMNPRIREIYDEPGWTGYEVVLDVWSGVFSWGLLAVPKDIKPDENRPTVVLQHGIGGTPTTPINTKSYKRVLPALVNRGFVVFSPHNPYQFNIRKANPVKTSVFSVIIPQHEQILNFLGSLDYVDPDRIALYGKSWGGRTALRVPIVLEGYSAIISSAYFNDWLLKSVSTDYRNSYFFEGSLGIYEWNMGNTFTHAEMAALIAPRPFMVENGRLDGVASDPSVAYEFAKVQRLYDELEIGNRVELEFFMGGHDINGDGTFKFLHEQLDWPAPAHPSKDQLIVK